MPNILPEYLSADFDSIGQNAWPRDSKQNSVKCRLNQMDVSGPQHLECFEIIWVCEWSFSWKKNDSNSVSSDMDVAQRSRFQHQAHHAHFIIKTQHLLSASSRATFKLGSLRFEQIYISDYVNWLWSVFNDALIRYGLLMCLVRRSHGSCCCCCLLYQIASWARWVHIWI